MRYVSIPEEVFAVQWFENGDHPEDNVMRPFEDGSIPGEPREGLVVRYFRHPSVAGDAICQECGKTFHVHGFIDMTISRRNLVCPGDYVITMKSGERWAIKADEFWKKYRRVED